MSDAGYDLERFLDDLRGTGTEISGPRPDPDADPWDDHESVERLVTAHRGSRVEPPYRLRLDERQFADAVEHGAAVVGAWWPGSDARERAYAALLLSFDAALFGIDRTPHGFVREEDDHLHLTRHHPCPNPMAHLDRESGHYTWSAYEPGTPEFEEEQAHLARRSRHGRHADLVRAWLVVEAAMDAVRLDPAVNYLQDRVADAFGGSAVMTRFTDHVRARGLAEDELVEIAYADDERFDALLDALAGESEDG